MVKPARPQPPGAPTLSSDRSFWPGTRSPANSSKFCHARLTPQDHSDVYTVWKPDRIDNGTRLDLLTVVSPVLHQLESATVRPRVPIHTGADSYPIYFWLTRRSPLGRY